MFCVIFRPRDTPAGGPGHSSPLNYPAADLAGSFCDLRPFLFLLLILKVLLADGQFLLVS